MTFCATLLKLLRSVKKNFVVFKTSHRSTFNRQLRLTFNINTSTFNLQTEQIPFDEAAEAPHPKVVS